MDVYWRAHVGASVYIPLQRLLVRSPARKQLWLTLLLSPTPPDEYKHLHQPITIPCDPQPLSLSLRLKVIPASAHQVTTACTCSITRHNLIVLINENVDQGTSWELDLHPSGILARDRDACASKEILLRYVHGCVYSCISTQVCVCACVCCVCVVYVS